MEINPNTKETKHIYPENRHCFPAFNKSNNTENLEAYNREGWHFSKTIRITLNFSLNA